MTPEAISQELFTLDFRAAMSQEYFQILAWRWDMISLSLNFVVCIATLAGVATAAGKPKSLGKYSLPLALGTVGLAWLLMLIPSGQWAQQYRDFARDWNSVEQSAKQLESEVNRDGVNDRVLSRLSALNTRNDEILGREPSTWDGLVKRCYSAQLERMYGKGLDTQEKVLARLKELGIEPPKPRALPPPLNQQAIIN